MQQGQNKNLTAHIAFIRKEAYNVLNYLIDSVSRQGDVLPCVEKGASAGVPPFNYHERRHHAASTLAAKGAGIADIKDVLGHERAQTTARYLQSLGKGVVGDRLRRRGVMALLEESAT